MGNANYSVEVLKFLNTARRRVRRRGFTVQESEGGYKMFPFAARNQESAGVYAGGDKVTAFENAIEALDAAQNDRRSALDTLREIAK